MNQPYSIRNVCTEILFDRLPFMYNTIFLKKTLIEVGSLHLYASFGTFYVQIGWLFLGTASLWKMYENGKIAVFEGKWKVYKVLLRLLKEEKFLPLQTHWIQEGSPILRGQYLNFVQDWSMDVRTHFPRDESEIYNISIRKRSI